MWVQMQHREGLLWTLRVDEVKCASFCLAIRNKVRMNSPSSKTCLPSFLTWFSIFSVHPCQWKWMNEARRGLATCFLPVVPFTRRPKEQNPQSSAKEPKLLQPRSTIFGWQSWLETKIHPEHTAHIIDHKSPCCFFFARRRLGESDQSEPTRRLTSGSLSGEHVVGRK